MFNTEVTPHHDAPDTRVLYAAACQLLDREQAKDAAVMFRLMLALAPTDERCWLGLGLCHEQLGQLNVARELYMLGDAAQPSARCLLACARVLIRQERGDLAEEYFDRALETAERLDQPELVRAARLERRH